MARNSHWCVQTRNGHWCVQGYKWSLHGVYIASEKWNIALFNVKPFECDNCAGKSSASTVVVKKI